MHDVHNTIQFPKKNSIISVYIFLKNAKSVANIINNEREFFTQQALEVNTTSAGFFKSSLLSMINLL